MQYFLGKRNNSENGPSNRWGYGWINSNRDWSPTFMHLYSHSLSGLSPHHLFIVYSTLFLSVESVRKEKLLVAGLYSMFLLSSPLISSPRLSLLSPPLFSSPFSSLLSSHLHSFPRLTFPLLFSPLLCPLMTYSMPSSLKKLQGKWFSITVLGRKLLPWTEVLSKELRNMFTVFEQSRLLRMRTCPGERGCEPVREKEGERAWWMRGKMEGLYRNLY